MKDEYHLRRFLEVQDPIYNIALATLRHGRMCTQYLDFIFPRLDDCQPDLARSPYSVSSLDEARAYLAFPVLGDRYRESAETLTWLGDMMAAEVFGEPGAMKLHASLTLFAQATNEPLFRTVLAVWFDNLVDEDTIVRLDLAP